MELCRKRFKDDRTKSFFLYDSSRVADQQRAYSAELALSLDVIYHLVEDTVYETYMTHLFTMASRFVIIYSSDMEDATLAKHVIHRKFTSWVSKEMLGWELSQRIQNRYPHDPKTPNETSFSDFYVYTNRAH